ncbi:MAG: SDR family oxidoreductase [Vicinamibacteria bacterium]|nr:SDR family oxidoreductase [Vicinamibacteria bacterium]
MRILITGASGLLGGRLATLLSENHEVTGLTRRRRAPDGITAVGADLAEEDVVRATLDHVRPKAVIHCAALADAEVCERERDLARRDNETATRTLARACTRNGIRLLSISTDLVFGGGFSHAREDSPTDPVMEYGRSKLRSEAAALEESPAAVILRVALVCGRGHGPRMSASEGIAHRLRSEEPVTLYEDEWRTPIDPESVANAIHAVLRQPKLTGLFHLGGPERLSRFEFGERVARALGLDSGLLRRASQASHLGAPRARDVSLDTGRARAELAWSPLPLEIALRDGR